MIQPPAAHREVARVVLAGVLDRVGHHVGVVGGRRVPRPLRLHVGAGMLHVGRVDGGRLDEGDGDGFPGLLKLHAQSVRERLDGGFRGGVRPLEDHGPVRQHRAQVDQLGRHARPRLALATVLLDGLHRAADDAPIIGVEQLALVLPGHVHDGAVDRDAGVVDPGVDPAEPLHRPLAHAGDGVAIAHVGHHREGLPAPRPDLAHQFVERVLVARHDHQRSAAAGQPPCGGEADAGRRAGEDDDLLFEGLQVHRDVLRSGCAASGDHRP